MQKTENTAEFFDQRDNNKGMDMDQDFEQEDPKYVPNIPSPSNIARYCIESDTDYEGHDINASEDLRFTSWKDCADECVKRRNKGCKYWTYNINGQCFLKNSKAGKRYINWSYSGPRWCKGV
jgi:hypothetical protein